ncbi:MAG TPA: protein kinase [Deltaproteobacteria bacterium]|nr:protein kinase [Deltaproteobacteria bacterium]HQI81751.1 protein kinase [Deltaproteobacteria bacterium]
MNYGRYEITKELGKGSMGVVYEAHDPRIGRVVALKVLRQDKADDEVLIKRFLREAKAIGRLSHPHIVTIHDVGEDNGNVYIAMEFLEGRPLNELIREQRFTIAEIVDMGIQMAQTLHYAHEKGVIHRDIKPSNIIIQPGCRIKITDFGIARVEDSTATLQTQTGEIMGTPAYMSPEQVVGKPVDRRTDIFSLGVVLYELSTGRRPFGGPGKTLATLFNDIMQENPVEPAAVNAPAEVPAGVSAVIMKCLSKNADERYQTGQEVALALQDAMAEKKEEAPLQPAAQEKGRPEGKRSRVVVFLLIAAIALAAAGGGTYYYLHHRVRTQPQLPEAVRPAATASQPALPAPVQQQAVQEAPEPASSQAEAVSQEPAQPPSAQAPDSESPGYKEGHAENHEQEAQKETTRRQVRTKPRAPSPEAGSSPVSGQDDAWGIGELRDRTP